MVRILIFFYKCCFYKEMGPKKGRRVRKIDTPTEFELGDRAADIQRRWEEREARESEEEA